MTPKIEIVTFYVEGTHGLLMRNPDSMSRTSEVTMNRKVIPSAADEAKSNVYATEDGFMWFPAQAFKSAMVKAVGGKRIGKATARSVISCTVFPAEERVLLIHPKTKKQIRASEFDVDTRRVVVQKSGIKRSRPLVKAWACLLPLEIRETISVDVALQALQAAGTDIGVGDYRPQTGGPFGRFKVTLAK